MLNFISLFFNFASGLLITIYCYPIYADKLNLNSLSYIAISNNLLAFIFIFSSSVVFVFAREYQMASSLYKSQIINVAILNLKKLSFILLFMMSFFYIWLLLIDFNDEKYYFSLLMVAYSIIIVNSSIYQVYSFSNNKLYVYNSINALTNIIRNGVFLFLLVAHSFGIIYLAYVSIVCAIFNFLANKYIYRTEHSNNIKNLREANVSKDLYINVLWVVLNSIVSFILNFIDVILVGVIYGSEQAGIYALLVAIPLAMRSFGNLFSTGFSSVANSISDLGVRAKYTTNSILVSILLIVPISSLVVSYSSHILSLWLNSDILSKMDVSVFQCLVILSCISTVFFPVVNALNALKKFKLLSLLNFSVSIISIVIVGIIYTNFNYTIVAMIFFSSVAFKNSVLNLILFFYYYGMVHFFNFRVFFKLVSVFIFVYIQYLVSFNFPFVFGLFIQGVILIVFYLLHSIFIFSVIKREVES